MLVLAIQIREGGSGRLYGSELSLLELGNALASLGIEILTVETFPTISHTRSTGFRTFQLRRRKLLPFRLLSYLTDTIWIANTQGCDIIYAHANYWLETTFVADFASVITRKKLYVGVLDRFKEDEDSLDIAKLIRMMAFKRQPRSLFFAMIRRAAVNHANACITPNSTVAKYAMSTLRARKATVIGRRVSNLFFERNRELVKYDACYVGRVSEGKGISELLLAWSEVVKTMPDALLAIAGSADQQVRAQSAAEKLICQLGIERNVRFLGYLQDPALVHKFHLSSKMFVFPSRREGFARAVAEAMASGIPCILSDLPELHEVYSDAAIYVPLNDHRSLASAILTLLQDDLKREELGEKAALFVKRYSWERVAEAFLQTVNPNVRASMLSTEK